MDNLPKVSLIICSYNQEAYIREAVESALLQTYSPIEIIISDDCSTDSTFPIIQEMVAKYTGKNTIIINRNGQNMGLIEHVNKVFGMATGDLVIGSAGDDVSLPERVETLMQMYRGREGKPTLFHGNVFKIGPCGEDCGLMEPGWGVGSIDINETALRDALYIGASSAFNRALLNRFPPMKYKNAFEDLVWGFRAALVDAVVYYEKPLLKYRVEVGISWKLHQVNDESFEEKLKCQRRKLVMLRDVVAQRLFDIDIVSNNPVYDDVRKLLNKKRLRLEIDISLLNPSLHTIKLLCLNPLFFYKRYRSLVKFKRCLGK